LTRTAAVLALLLPVSAAAQLTEPGISLELARHRAATLSHLRYDVAFRLPASLDSAVTGTLTLRFHRQDDGPLILDFAEPDRVRAMSRGAEPVEYSAVADHLVVPAAALSGGENELTIAFEAGEGPLNRRGEFLYTLFVPDRAHEAFPSFDQPDLRARFRLELDVPAGWVAVANGAVADRDSAGDRVVYRFAETAPIPSYLFAFAAGRFRIEEAERAGRRMRMFHRETDAELVARNVDAVFDLHATALAWLEDYTGIPYPFGKFDFVAIPSFQYNGMEHPGAILYRGSGLFLDESATRNEELGRASVIAHETAHMWFGDLVTMPWFDDVWMKEVFANFMAAKIVNPSFPELDHELRFLVAHYPGAYGVDRTPGANPVRQPLENLDDAGSLYGAIIYQKAPIVMRQLERLTGEAAFRAALRRYLAAHAFGNAGWPDLVAELDREAPLDVAAWSRIWIEEPGRPRIDLIREPGAIRLLPSDPRGDGRVWTQRTRVAAVGKGSDGAAGLDTIVTVAGEPIGLRMDGATERAVLPNRDGLGYGLFMLDDASRERLLHELPSLPEPLSRAVAWLDLWEMMLEGAVAPPALMDVALRIIPAEADELVAQQVLGDVPDLFWRYLDPVLHGRLSAGLEEALWRGVLGAEDASLKAAFLNAWRSVATSPEAVERMGALWSAELEVEGLPLSEQDRTRLALHLAVREAPGWAEILHRQREAIENPDRQERFDFIRPAVDADPAVRDSFFRSLARPANRSREEWVVAALGYLHHPLRAEGSLRFLRPSLELLPEVARTGDIFFPTRWLSATLSGHASAEAAAVVRAFIDERPDLPPRLVGKLLQEADPLFRAVVLRK